jgi:uncharacterized RDD family membrane protein YckC
MSERPTPRPESPGYITTPPPGAGGPPVTSAPGALSGQHVLAGWWSRAGAQVIDWLIVGVGGILLAIAIMAPFSILWFADEGAGLIGTIVGAIIAVLCASVAALLYAPALMARTNGQTLGRMVTGIRVVRANGEPMTFSYAMLREVAVKTLLIGIAASLTGGLAYLADYLWPLWDEENRALHDMIVNSRVIRA